jgi:twitching motility two-component system response regulator PilH
MKTVLVVDDMQAELQLITGYLAEGGYAVITATNGNEALEKVETQIPDAIITDLVMPEMSGLELCRKLKKTPETANIPVIVCTTKDRKVDESWAKKQGVSVYLTKPCNQAQLLEAVQSVTS